MNITHTLQKILRNYCRIGVFVLAAVLLAQQISCAYLVREQEAAAVPTLNYTSSSDSGYDFVKIPKQSTTARSVSPARPVPQITTERVERSVLTTKPTARSSVAVAPLPRQQRDVRTTKAEPRYAPPPQESKPVYEIQQPTKTEETVIPDLISEPLYPERKVIHRTKAQSSSTLPQEFITRTGATDDLSIDQQHQQKQRYLDALYLRAEAYYDVREYNSCMQTLNSIFMFDPYHVKAQRLKRKVEIKASKKRSGREGPSLLNRIFGNSKHRKQIGVARKLYKDGKYEEAIKICQRIILEDPYNNKAERYLTLSKQRLDEKMAAPVNTRREPPESAGGIEKYVPMTQPDMPEEEMVVQEEAPVAPVITKSEVAEDPLQRNDISAPEDKEAAQEIALNAMLESMNLNQAPQEKVEERRPVQPAAMPIPMERRDPTMEELAVMARSNLENNNLENAQEILNQMLVKDSDDPRAQKVMNDISQWIQETERSKFDSAFAKKRRQETIDQAVKKGKKAYKSKKYNQARMMYEKALALDPANRTARKGIDKIEKKEKKETLKSYRTSVETLHQKKRYDEATVLIDKGLALDPTNRTFKRLKKKNATLRVSAASEVLAKKQAGTALPEADRGQVQRPASKEKKKMGFFSFFTDMNAPPTQDEIKVKDLLVQAKSAYRKSDCSKAISLYEEVLRLDPGNKKASRGIDRAREKLILKGRKKSAKEIEMETEVQEKIEFYTSMAGKLHRQGKYDSAKIVIQKGLLLDPDDAELKQLRNENNAFVKRSAESPAATEQDRLNVKKNALVSKGVKQYLLGDYDGAVKYFNQVLELDPTDEKAQNSIEKITRRQQRLNLSTEQE